MFKKTKIMNDSREKTPSTSLISEGTVVSGDLCFEGELYVGGKLEGNVNSGNGSVTVTETGCVNGNISSTKIIVDGYVKGDIFAKSDIQLTKNAEVHGRVFYKKIIVSEGAMVTGSLIFNPNEIQKKTELLDAHMEPASKLLEVAEDAEMLTEA